MNAVAKLVVDYSPRHKGYAVFTPESVAAASSIGFGNTTKGLPPWPYSLATLWGACKAAKEKGVAVEIRGWAAGASDDPHEFDMRRLIAKLATVV